MKIPLRFQCTEYDCGTTSFINALLYLYDREDIPIEFIKAIYKYTLDVEDKEGIIGKGGTSRSHAERLARFFVRYANINEKTNIKTHILCNDKVDLINMKSVIERGGVAIARVWQQGEHYVIITKIDENFAYIFDPYYLNINYYDNDEDIEIIKNKPFEFNRKVKKERMEEYTNRDFALVRGENSEIIIIENTK